MLLLLLGSDHKEASDSSLVVNELSKRIKKKEPFAHLGFLPSSFPTLKQTKRAGTYKEREARWYPPIESTYGSKSDAVDGWSSIKRSISGWKEVRFCLATR